MQNFEACAFTVYLKPIGLPYMSVYLAVVIVQDYDVHVDMSKP